MNVRPSEYGSRGIAALGVPQANPTVEQEAFALRPSGLSLVTTRLTSSAPGLQERLCDYLTETEHYAGRFDDLAVDVFGIACTGSSYLLGLDEERALMARVSEQLGYPVISAAGAIQDSLKMLGVSRISIVAPYPDWLVDRAKAFWSAAGFEVVELQTIELASDNVHTIYQLTSDQAIQAASKLNLDGVEAILFTGTGMPTLGAIRPLSEQTGLAVLSSNLCLMTSLCRERSLTTADVLDVPADLDTATL